MSYIADNLNALCIVHGLTERQLAELAGLKMQRVNKDGELEDAKPEQTVSKWFTGKRNIEPRVIERIMRNTGWAWDDVYDHAGGAAARLIPQLLSVGWENLEQIGLYVREGRTKTLRARWEASVADGGWGETLPRRRAYVPLFTREDVGAIVAGDEGRAPLDTLWVPVPDDLLRDHPFAFAVASDDAPMYGSLPKGSMVVLDHEPAWQQVNDYELVLAVPDGGSPVVRRAKLVGGRFLLTSEPSVLRLAEAAVADAAEAALGGRAFDQDECQLVARVVYVFSGGDVVAKRLGAAERPRELEAWVSLLAR